jgi:hypothetical protein
MVMTHESGMVTAADGRRCSTAKPNGKWFTQDISEVVRRDQVQS